MFNLMYFTLLWILIQVVSIHYVVAKECTNIPTQVSFQAVQAQLLSSKDDSQPHLTPTDDAAWSNLYPGKVLLEQQSFDWEMMYRKIKYSDGSINKNATFLKEVSLHDVRLHPDSIYASAQQTNLEYMLMLDVNSLAWNFRKTANLPTPGKPYGGWEAPDGELRGHFVGHYLSATAQMYASTHNKTLFDKMNELISALNDCQQRMGTGYLSAFPTELFDRVEAIKPVWAPYYTVHKIMAGLLDHYSICGNALALKMVVGMADYFTKRVENVITKYSLERHYLSLNTETGGMNDVFYKLYSITRTKSHLAMAALFDKPCFLGMLALQADSLSGFHANTHIPIVIGTQMRYELTGDPLYKEMGSYFMDVVNSSHCYATGGTSVDEQWSDPSRLATTLKPENEETCTTYNMLKVSRNLFKWTKEMAYADYYERALMNGLLSVQRGTDPGVMIYMLPLSRGASKARSFHGWGTQFDSFWCCYGTGLESFSKLGDSIYFEEGNHQVLYIVQFISSTFNWKSGGVVIDQQVQPAVSWDRSLRATFNFSVNGNTGKSFTLNLRIPLWVDKVGAHAKLNGADLPLPAPGSFLSVKRLWNSGDKLSLELPMILRTEGIKDDRPEFESLQAILYGPFLLAGLTIDDWDLKTGTNALPTGWITPIPTTYNSQLVTLHQQSNTGVLALMNIKNTLSMEMMPPAGNETAPYATFRFISQNANYSNVFSEANFIGKSFVIEPFNLPGMTVVQQQGPNPNIAVANTKPSAFRVVEGLAKDGTVSLESESQKGCFLYSGVNYNAGTKIKLSCKSGSIDPNFAQATSFKMSKGLSEYHPISFVAKGQKRDFLLMPLLSLRDESYTVYFNIRA